MGIVPRVNIIFDSRRQEMYEPLMKELAIHKITDYEIWPCIILPDVPESISESFKMVIRDAQEKGLEEVCIWEHDNFFTQSDGWEYFLKNKPDEYDIFVSGSYLTDNRYDWKPPYVKVDAYVGNHCILVHSKYFQKWLDTDPKKHCDTVHNNNADIKICFPFTALQRPGFSANTMAMVNYNAMLYDNEVLKGFVR